MQGFLKALLECSVSMSAISLVYIIAMPLLSKRYTAQWRYYAWMVIVIGWILPFRFHFDPALFPNVNMPTIQVIPAEQVVAGNPLMIIANKTDMVSSISLWGMIASVWLIGAFGKTVYQISRHWRFIKMVSRWREDVTNSEILDMWELLKAEMRIKKHVELKTCPGITAPMMIGFRRPTVLLPVTTIATGELTLILRHELVHLKKKHLWHKALVLLATIIHWFNPVVYIMAKAVAVECEISCDEQVLKGASFQQRKQYGETIIGIVRQGIKLRTALSTNFHYGKKIMKIRISSIMDTRKKKPGITALCIVLISIIGAEIIFAADFSKEATEGVKITADTNAKYQGFINKTINSIDNYSKFLTKVESDPVKYYYNGYWVRSLYDENNETGETVLYLNAIEDKDVLGKKPTYLKTIRNKETNEIEKLAEMSEDEVFLLLDNDNVMKFSRNPFD